MSNILNQNNTMRKSQIIQMITDIAIEVTECENAMNDEEKNIARKISEQDNFDFSSLNTEEIEYVTSFLYFSHQHSIEDISVCIDFLLVQRH